MAKSCNHILGSVSDVDCLLFVGSVEKNLRYSYTVINSKSKTFKDNVKRSLNDRFKERRKKFRVL